MAYEYLALKPQNDFDVYFENKKYTYLVLRKVEKPSRRSKKTEQDYADWEAQQATLARLATGHYNCYNQPLRPESICDNLTSLLTRLDDYFVYKIEPTSSTRAPSSYLQKEQWCFYEFNVVKQIETEGELFSSVCEDFLGSTVITHLISELSCSFPEAECCAVWEKVKTAFPSMKEHVYFSDILNGIRVRVAEKEDTALYNLMANDDITVASKYDSPYESLLSIAMDKKLYKSMVFYTVKKLEEVDGIELSEQNVRHLQKHADNPDVAKIIELLKPKFERMLLTIIRHEDIEDGYSSRDTTTTVEVKDASEAKIYIARNFNVSFAELQKDIGNICFSNEDEWYEFRLNND